ncbi:MAG: glycosyltransferase family 39 protein [Candidatus Roizmanbacteria bacterium]|nr:glycosyltransferase family 39 protein [Candidatus Roizmanbacteria bacterium]MCR4313407.1 glycosyltransferase family 39 protein [Candidatus Roizmanbacteria bacterium]
MKKINGKVFSFIIWFIVIGILVYSRFINLDWGLPYPMHPDERNMVAAIQGLKCEFSIFNFQFSNLKECFNPHFFAYGQFPLYLGYLIAYFLKLEATISLRIISAIASIINALILLKIIKSIIFNFQFSIFNKFSKFNFQLFSLIIIIFSPFFIQFSHFGTTESLLMLFYSLIVYLSMLMFERRTTASVVWLALVSGLAVATKVSSIIFIIVPLITILSSLRSWDRYKNLVKFGMLTIIFVVLFSPHNFINFKDFISSMNYESNVALGRSLVFYTRQFFKTQPILFQFEKVFSYALGWPVFLMGLMGLIGANWKDRKTNLLRFAFLIYFIPSAIIYAKWSRFMAPVFPLILIFSVLFLLNLISKLNHKFWIPAFAGMTMLAIIPGVAYLSIYQNQDVRFQASKWIYKNVPNNSYILSETANVVDIPISNGTMEQLNNYNVISFNFYDLDENKVLRSELNNHLIKADYIFIPSRRVFANHPAERYPILGEYYRYLFNGKLGYEKVAEFESFPKICLPFYNEKCLSFNDENAEETWTVFDHPVIRIYKKIKS